MKSQPSAPVPETIGLIVREYLKGLRPESSGSTAIREWPSRSAGELLVPRENSSSRRDGPFFPEFKEVFRRPTHPSH
jgi:hypothetical protein